MNNLKILFILISIALFYVSIKQFVAHHERRKVDTHQRHKLEISEDSVSSAIRIYNLADSLECSLCTEQANKLIP